MRDSNRSTGGICHNLAPWEQARTVDREAAKEAVQLSGDPRQPVTWHSLEERECGPDIDCESARDPENVADRIGRDALLASPEDRADVIGIGRVRQDQVNFTSCDDRE